MPLLGKLGVAPTLQAHLLRRRREELIGGVQRTFPPGALRPGDLVTCRIRGRRLATGVPIEAELSTSTGYGGAGVTTVSLAVTRHSDGSVVAVCT